VDALIAVSAGHAQAVQSHALVAMHDTLQGQVAPGSAAEPEQVSAVLGALVALAQAHPSHFAFTLPRFVAELQGLVARCCGGDGAGSAAAAPVACRVLGAMADAFGDSVDDELSGAAAQHAGDTHACIAGFVQLAAVPEGGEQVVDAAEAALRRVVQVMPPDGQGAVAAAAVGKLLEGVSPGSCGTQFGRTSLLRATAAVVTALSGAVAVPQCPELLVLLQNVVAWNPAASRVDARVAGQCLGSIFNKDTSGSLAQAQREVVEHLTAGCRGLSALSCVRVVVANDRVRCLNRCFARRGQPGAVWRVPRVGCQGAGSARWVTYQTHATHFFDSWHVCVSGDPQSEELVRLVCGLLRSENARYSATFAGGCSCSAN